MQHERDMFLYAWDVIDEGARPMAQRLSALGVTSVSLAAVYHSGKLLLPHNPKRCVLVLEDNRSYFPSDPGRYGTLRPAESELLRGHNPEFWNEMLHEFHACNIRVCAWVVVFHADRLARMYPEYALHNAWGEPSPPSLCPSGEEAFRYGLSLLEDVVESGLVELHLESAEYGGFLHGAHHEMQAYADCSGLERLLSPCFCPACIERAQRGGVDAERLREEVRNRAFRFFNLEPAELEDESLRQAWNRLRTQRITEFYAQLRARLDRRGLTVKVKPILWMTGGADPLCSGVDVRQLAPFIDGALAAYPSSPQDVEAFAARARAFVPAHVPLSFGVRLMAPQTTRPEQVAEYLAAYRNQGVNSLFFYNYGMAPLPFLEALSQ